MAFIEKIEEIDNKIEQSEAKYYLDRQTVKISALSSGHVGKWKTLTDEDFLSEKGL